MSRRPGALILRAAEPLPSDDSDEDEHEDEHDDEDEDEHEDTAGDDLKSGLASGATTLHIQVDEPQSSTP